MEEHDALSALFKGKGLRLVTRGAARRAADMRAVNNAFRLWQHCCLAVCRRARACTDEAHTCFRDHADIFSPGQLRWIDAVLVARRMGLGWEEAKASATRALAHRRSLSQTVPGHAPPKNPAPAPSARCRSG
jgi:hypothetical protein